MATTDTSLRKKTEANFSVSTTWNHAPALNKHYQSSKSPSQRSLNLEQDRKTFRFVIYIHPGNNFLHVLNLRLGKYKQQRWW